MSQPIKEDEGIDKGLWLFILIMILAGILTVIGFSIGYTGSITNFLTAASTGILIGGAFFTGGGLGGFLFGIPKLLQNTTILDGKSARPVILHNDNLVQISDWLTKIIVGVGLTQLYYIPGFILKVGTALQNNFGGAFMGRNAAIAVILYFVVIGFFFAYIWTRIYFVKLLKRLDDELDPLNVLKQEIVDNKEQTENKVKISELTIKIERFESLKNKIINTENNFDGLKELFKVYKPGPIKWIDDCQKGRWGGKAEANGITLIANIQVSVTDSSIFTVNLLVSGSAANPLQGKVYFFLHDSYMPNQIMVAEAVANVAALSIQSYEAATVGVLCESGVTALELDLNEYPGSPNAFKYNEPLVSIDDLNDQKALLLSQQK